MADAPSNLRVLAQGFWLPSGRSNFFDPQRDRKLIGNFNAYENRVGSYHLVGKDTGGKRLNASVYRQLIAVLPSAYHTTAGGQPLPSGKRYSRAYPMYNVERLEQIAQNADPDSLALVCTRDDLGGRDDPGAPEWARVRQHMEGVVLMAVSEGFYVWFVLYRADPDSDQETTRREQEIRQALSDHIYDLVGGPFFNHSSGRDGAPPYVREQDVDTLKEYRDKDLGMLSFFQINLIFEGMYNAVLDPRTFFDTGVDPNKADKVKKSHSLGGFVRLITADAQIDPERTGAISQVTHGLWTLLNLPETLTAQEYFDLFYIVRRNCLNAWIRRDLLIQFLRQTTNETLNLFKLRLESCSRSLLGIMIRLAQLRQPVIQTDVPPPPPQNPEPPAQDRYAIPAGANEGQLRSYIILLAAKLPLIETVQHYLQSTLTRLKEITTDDLLPANPKHAKSIWRSIAGLQRAQDALLASIKEHLAGLERAIGQAYMDRMLAETEKLRAEEETLAEIQRIRQRTGEALTPSTELAVNVIANVIAVAGVVLAVVLGISQLSQITASLSAALGEILQRGPNAIVPGVLATVIAIVLGLASLIVLIGIYFLLQRAIAPVARFFAKREQKRQQRRRQDDEQYYYEMDLRLDATMDPPRGETNTDGGLPVALLRGDFAVPPHDSPWPSAPWSARRQYPYVDRRRHYQPKRNSYRVNRTGQDEALHKVYVMANIFWPGPHQTKPWRSATSLLRLFLVYEVLFHKPSDESSHVFKTFRLVSTTDEILTPERLDRLKQLVVSEFINRWIFDHSQWLNPQTDALMSLHTLGKAKDQ